MGPFEENLFDILHEIADNELLRAKMEEVMEAHCNIYALYAMSGYMAAQESASEMAVKRNNDRFQFFQGKIEAYRDLFIRVAFDGLSPEDGLTDTMLKEATEFWQQKVKALFKTVGDQR